MVDAWLESGCAAEEISLERHRREIRLRRKNTKFTIEFESEALAERFENPHCGTLLDVALACLDDDTGQGVLWAKADAGRLWLLSGAREGADWGGVMFDRAHMDFLREGPTTTCLREFLRRPVKAKARPVLDLLHDPTIGLGLPHTLPLIEALRLKPAGSHPRLTIKLDAGCEWLLLFPFELMSSPFAARWDIEWIATDKTCVQNLREREQIWSELSDLPTLLDRTVILLNTDYPHFREDPEFERLQRATELVRSLLNHLHSVDMQTGDRCTRHSLRYFENPDAQTIERALRSPETWYVIANFHVEGGCWIVDRTAPFSLERFTPASLCHLRLLRIYHCQSMFGTRDRTELWHSIVGKLLRAGARRVEGSPFLESYSTFLRQLVQLLAGEQGLGPVLTYQCLVSRVSLKNLLEDLEADLGNLHLT